MVPNCGVRGCFIGVATLLKDPPPLRKFDNIFTGDGGRNDFVLSPSGFMYKALRMVGIVGHKCSCQDWVSGNMLNAE